MPNARKQEFEKFYQANLDKIFRFVFFRVGGNRTLAEDLVSEIFLKALEHFPDYDPNRSSTAWLFTIAKNHLANHWRDRKPVETLPEEEDGAAKDKIWYDLAKRKGDGSSVKTEVGELLARLESDEREIVTLHYLCGYSYYEISVMRESSEGAVKVAAHRAVKKMRKSL